MNLPTREEFLASSITPADLSPEDKECSICKEDYDATTHTAVTFSDHASCNHVFGESCIVSWLNSNGVNSCPYCRHELFVLTVEHSDVDSGYGSGDDRDFESDSDSEDEEEEDIDEEEDDNIPLSWLYRDSLHTIIPAETLTSLLETTWYKTWHLLSTYQSEIEHDYQHGPIPYNRLYFDRYLPTTPMLLGSFLDTVAARVGADISGVLSERKIEILEALLGDMVEMQKGFVELDWKRSGVFVPEFPRTWVPFHGWLVSVNAAVGALAVATTSREGWVHLPSIRY